MDIELAIDVMELAEHLDHVVLFSGDGDFRSLIEAVQRQGRARDRRLDAHDAAADGRRRAAPPGRPVRRSRRPAERDRARSGRAAGPRQRERPAAPRTRAAQRPAAPDVGERRFDDDDLSRAASRAQPSSRGATARCCPRLVRLPRCNGAAQPDWFNAPVPSFGDRRGAAADRRPRAGPARRQPHRAALHRRLCRRSSLRDADRIRLCARRLIAPIPTTGSR